jgi:hypothetical protein
MVFPQETPEFQTFLQNHKIRPNQALSAPLSEVDVEGTPTILLVNAGGNIVRSWVGELQSAGQKEVIESVHLKTISEVPRPIDKVF